MSIKDLISEGRNKKLSLGRCAFWLLFAVMLYRAFTEGQIDTSLITLTFGLLAYGFGKKLPKISNALNKE